MINKELLEAMENMMGNAQSIVSIMEQQEKVLHEQLKNIKDPEKKRELLDKLKEAKKMNMSNLQSFQEKIQDLTKKK